MKHELKIGGLHRAGGNYEVGSFRHVEPAANMSVIPLHPKPKRKLVVRTVPMNRFPGRYVIIGEDEGEDEDVYFKTEEEVRAWMDAHNFVQRPRKKGKGLPFEHVKDGIWVERERRA